MMTDNMLFIAIFIALILVFVLGFKKYDRDGKYKPDTSLEKESYTLADYCKFKYCACRPRNPNEEDICT